MYPFGSVKNCVFHKKISRSKPDRILNTFNSPIIFAHLPEVTCPLRLYRQEARKFSGGQPLQSRRNISKIHQPNRQHSNKSPLDYLPLAITNIARHFRCSMSSPLPATLNYPQIVSDKIFRATVSPRPPPHNYLPVCRGNAASCTANPAHCRQGGPR